MFIQFSSYNHPISSVELNNNEDILLFKTSLYTYRFEALGDCCSVSKFKKFKDNDFSSIIGKIIKNVKEINEDDYEYDTENDDDMNCATPHIYQMTFKNSDETFKFLMVNYSNGYYDGWINSSVVF
jgi:hypothetical protein